MDDINNQVDYWNEVAWRKEFAHTVNLSLLREWLPLNSRVLDFGCGYGRVCQELVNAGYRDVVGVDSSAEMIRRGHHLYPDLALEILGPSGLSYPANSFDAILLIAVLTCVPEDQGQLTLMAALKRLLRPGGLIYISDYLLQSDQRNQLRYEQHVSEFGTYGVFRLPEGAVVRHHSRDWIESLTADFEKLDLAEVDAVTMNGHVARSLRYLGRKERIAIIDAWRVPEAREFFRNAWPMYVHELSGFDTDFYVLDEAGRWHPDIVEDWVSSVTPPRNLRVVRAEQDPGQPFQRAHIITRDARPVGFVCVGVQPFKYMPDDAEMNIAEFFLIHAARGTGTATRAFELVLRRYPGRWHLRAVHDNARAIRFWRKALSSVGVGDLEEKREDGDVVFRFGTRN